MEEIFAVKTERLHLLSLDCSVENASLPDQYIPFAILQTYEQVVHVGRCLLFQNYPYYYFLTKSCGVNGMLLICAVKAVTGGSQSARRRPGQFYTCSLFTLNTMSV